MAAFYLENNMISQFRKDLIVGIADYQSKGDMSAVNALQDAYDLANNHKTDEAMELLDLFGLKSVCANHPINTLEKK